MAFENFFEGIAINNKKLADCNSEVYCPEKGNLGYHAHATLNDCQRCEFLAKKEENGAILVKCKLEFFGKWHRTTKLEK